MADYSRQRAERDFNRNPPTNAPGQGSGGATGWDNMELDASFGGNGMDSAFSGNVDNMSLEQILNGGVSPSSGVPGQQSAFNPNDPLAMPSMPGQAINGQMQGNQPQQNPSVGERIENALFDVAEISFKGLWKFVVVFFTALTNNNARDWHRLGSMMVKLSLGEAALSVVLFILSMFVKSITDPLILCLAAVPAFGIGFLIVAGAKGKMEKEKVADLYDEPIPQEDFSSTGFEEPDNTGIDWGESLADDSEGSDDSLFEDDGDAWNWEDSEDEDSNWFGDDSSASIASADFDPSEEANKIDIPAGQYTRQYLLETFLKVLPSINPGFHKMSPVYEDSDEFMMFNEYLRDAAIQTGLNGDKLDELYLESVEQNPFVIRLMVTRPSGIKEQEIADGVADCYKRDEHGAVLEEREGCYASVDAQVGRFAINIFKCANVMVSLGDVLKYKYDWVSNPKITMPLFWGVNEMGKVYCYDGVKAGNGSMLISGEGRSGKSWKGQSLVAQMSMFMSPKEINFYFFDNKGKLSDYYYLSTKLPHVKGFCGDPLKYVSTLKDILEREKPIRERAIHSAGVNNINDYNKLNPTNKLPYIYIVVDEMAAAMKEMDAHDKELHKQFNSLMLSIVTNLPYFGIRLLLFPHRLVDFIIDKTTAQQISCRSVVGVLDFETLKSALDIKNKKDFPYNLVKPGDMAIRTKDIRNGVATFTKSEVLSDSETTNRKIFDYIGAVWGKLEPDCKPVVRYDDGKGTGRKAKDVSSSVGDYSVRNAFNEPKKPFFSDEEDEGASIDELLEDSVDDDGFWSNWKG